MSTIIYEPHHIVNVQIFLTFTINHYWNHFTIKGGNTTGRALKGSTERLSYGTNAYIENTGKNTYIKLPEEILYGDIDLDNTVMDDDALLLLKYFNDMAELDEGQLAAAKITDHSKAKPDILDAIKIIQTS